jgi:hypothetical protein
MVRLTWSETRGGACALLGDETKAGYSGDLEGKHGTAGRVFRGNVGAGIDGHDRPRLNRYTNPVRKYGA